MATTGMRSLAAEDVNRVMEDVENVVKEHGFLSSKLGLLDLGGSSLQMVAEVDDIVVNEHVFRSKIGFVEHDIIAFSLPSYGLNEAFDRTVIMLSHTREHRESVSSRFEVRHPCLGAGFVQNYACHGCFRLVSRESGNFEPSGSRA
ncbi:probable apyrase 7 [Olea europaea subsp. europaea]|uniref:Probable apyrase 7 n=1 Tax=Olea europaea subsp. europaea TaxID=158383 RepID=A0A8S0PTP1_OLEEU|nr:probable apyrase 7 [Olea europaea subsp. europaea]